ncbi:MAG: hypothetical protein GF331_04385, partial [Chitinivibrionales bacterium]|nr:hypothetical protein [Chitinivibrionales bacterium]
MVYDWGDIRLAYDYVSAGMQFEHEALLDRKTGQIHYADEFEGEVFPDEFCSDRY